MEYLLDFVLGKCIYYSIERRVSEMKVERLNFGNKSLGRNRWNNHDGKVSVDRNSIDMKSYRCGEDEHISLDENGVEIVVFSSQKSDSLIAENK